MKRGNPNVTSRVPWMIVTKVDARFCITEPIQVSVGAADFLCLLTVLKAALSQVLRCLRRADVAIIVILPTIVIQNKNKVAIRNSFFPFPPLHDCICRHSDRRARVASGNAHDEGCHWYVLEQGVRACSLQRHVRNFRYTCSRVADYSCHLHELRIRPILRREC